MKLKVGVISVAVPFAVVAAVASGAAASGNNHRASARDGATVAHATTKGAHPRHRGSHNRSSRKAQASQSADAAASAFTAIAKGRPDVSATGLAAQQTIKHMNGQAAVPYALGATPYGDVTATVSSEQMCIVVSTPKVRTAGCSPVADATNPSTPIVTTIADGGDLTFFALLPDSASAPKLLASDGGSIAVTGNLAYGRGPRDGGSLQFESPHGQVTVKLGV
jgi:hypothetical protein